MVLIGVLARRGARPGLRHASASGMASGVASALTQTVTVAATDSSGPLLSWQVIGVALLVAAFAAGGLILSQTAYRGGLGGPLALVTLANPVAAAVIGLTLLGERLQGGASGLLLALAGAGLAGWGVVTLSRATPDPVPVSVPVSPERVVIPSAAAAAASASAAASVLDDEEHPVASVLALEAHSAPVEPSLMPRQPSEPGHITSL
jgi:hypothetical protein